MESIWPTGRHTEQVQENGLELESSHAPKLQHLVNVESGRAGWSGIAGALPKVIPPQRREEQPAAEKEPTQWTRSEQCLRARSLGRAYAVVDGQSR
eukprot:6175514-Pleurochrysis_carterae.AAC.2